MNICGNYRLRSDSHSWGNSHSPENEYQSNTGQCCAFSTHDPPYKSEFSLRGQQGSVFHQRKIFQPGSLKICPTARAVSPRAEMQGHGVIWAVLWALTSTAQSRPYTCPASCQTSPSPAQGSPQTEPLCKGSSAHSRGKHCQTAQPALRNSQINAILFNNPISFS